MGSLGQVVEMNWWPAPLVKYQAPSGVGVISHENATAALENLKPITSEVDNDLMLGAKTVISWLIKARATGNGIIIFYN